MTEKLTHRCIICGTRYHSCDTCERIRTYTPWRTICDSFEHYKIYIALRAYEEGFETKDQIRAALDNLGVKKGTYDNWSAKTKEKLDKIFSEPKRANKAKTEPTTEEVVNEEEAVEILNDSEALEK